ncbi:MAG: class III cytochrome C family protein [Magnetococcales bacterium]|nr:class III cytochrome C family protein [Magnetococcales bacterium]NGZ04785.1 class III cytochrome C family protein [Magnetococcales bacterium]
MKRLVPWILGINLALIALLVLLYPHLMVAPGSLISGHRSLERDCFACHDWFAGATSNKCLKCHKSDSIGVLNTKGKPLAVRKSKTPFHQKLTDYDCVACHGDHVGVAKYRVVQRFSHQLLDAATREGCVACHARPKDGMHRLVTDLCSQCHGTERWKPARFNHDLLSASQRAACVECHQAKTPTDGLHRQLTAPCSRCHTLTAWKPATYDHRQSFALDRDHDVKCVTCHPSDDYKNYTCYGCHEHNQGKIRKEHLEEGIRDFERCVLCHRNANEDDAKQLWRSGRWRDGLPPGTPVPLLDAPRDSEKGHKSERSKSHGKREEHDD